VSPLRLTLPDGRGVELRIDSQSEEYVRLANDWERRVGKSRGSSAYYWLGVIVYQVDNVTIQALFIHRVDEWLVVLSSELDAGSNSRLNAFLSGFTLLGPEASAAAGP
jgi:hypothetical protein